MDFADGELLRTSETVVCDSSKCSARVLKLTCPDGVDSFVLAMLEVVARFGGTRNTDSTVNTSIFLRSNDKTGNRDRGPHPGIRVVDRDGIPGASVDGEVIDTWLEGLGFSVVNEVASESAGERDGCG